MRRAALLRLRRRPVRVPPLEPLDAASGVDELLLAGIEGMALRAKLDVELRLRGTRRERIAARAANVRRHVLGMDTCLHVPLLSGVVASSGVDGASPGGLVVD